MKECPGNCEHVLRLLRTTTGWLTFDQLQKLGMKRAEARRVNTLVRLGLVERESVPSPTCGHYARFRAMQVRNGTLFDLPPAERTLVNPKGPAVRSPRPGNQP